MSTSKPQPSFNLKRLKQLQSRIDRDKDLGEFWEFYMSHFADHPEFLDFGGRVENPFLSEIIPRLSETMVKKKPRTMLFIRIPEYNFIHGSFQLPNKIGAFVYFEKKLKGVVAISDLTGSGMTKFSRFTGYPVDNN